MTHRRHTEDTTTGNLAGAGEGYGPGLWFALLGGAGAWAVQFLVGYLVTEGVCVGSSGIGGASGISVGISVGTGAILSVIGVSVVAFIIAVAAAFSGRRFWLRVRDDTGGGGFVGLTGMLLSAVFAFVIAVQVLPLFLGGGCA